MTNKNNSIPNDWEKWHIKSFREIRAVINFQGERIIGVPVSGDNLKEHGILHGDILITRITEKFTEDKLCVFDTPDGRTAKFAYENFGEISLENKHGWIKSYPLQDVKCLGVVIRVERDLE